MPSTTTIMPISLPRTLARDLDSAAREADMTRSEFVRDALRRALSLRQLQSFRMQFARQARKQGVRTLKNAVRIVQEVRGTV